MGLLPYFPLASGLLTGKYRRGAPLPAGTRLAKHASALAERVLTEANWAKLRNSIDFAEARGHTLLELGVLLAAGARAGGQRDRRRHPARAGSEQNVAAGGWQLSAEDMAEIDRIAA